MNLRYRIPEISAMQVLSAIEEKDGQLYLYLDPEDLSRDYLVNQTLQDDCPMFFQAMRVLGEKIEAGGICDALFHAFVYVDFSGIFDRTPAGRTLELQQKAEKLFRPEGLWIDLGKGYEQYFAFERSASMSRNCKLSFVRADLCKPLWQRMMLDMHIGKCQLSSNPYEQIEYARNALCAWCSIPEEMKKAPDGRPNPKVNFSDLASAFPELVDEDGSGWLYRHVQSTIQFVKGNPSITSKSAADNCEILKEGFTRVWKKKVRQMQVPAFALNTKGAWILRFDDILADALELGPLQNYDISLPQETLDLLAERTPKGVPDTLLPMLAKYYLAHLQDGEEWVVLPVSTVDAYYGSNSFSKKWKPLLPKEFVEFKNSYGICKYKIIL